MEVRHGSCVEDDASFVLCRGATVAVTKEERDIPEEEEATGGPKLSHRSGSFQRSIHSQCCKLGQMQI